MFSIPHTLKRAVIGGLIGLFIGLIMGLMSCVVWPLLGVVVGMIVGLIMGAVAGAIIDSPIIGGLVGFIVGVGCGVWVGAMELFINPSPIGGEVYLYVKAQITVLGVIGIVIGATVGIIVCLGKTKGVFGLKQSTV